jgi:hypothetical protein
MWENQCVNYSFDDQEVTQHTYSLRNKLCWKITIALKTTKEDVFEPFYILII